jgi:hypothetical protein
LFLEKWTKSQRKELPPSLKHWKWILLFSHSICQVTFEWFFFGSDAFFFLFLLLEGCQIGSEGVKVLREALKINTSLKQLNLASIAVSFFFYFISSLTRISRQWNQARRHHTTCRVACPQCHSPSIEYRGYY